jgi:hypothetical protein
MSPQQPVLIFEASAVRSRRIAFGLLDPLPHRSLGQVDVLRDLTGRPVPALAQLHDLGLELRSKRAAPARRGFFPMSP